MKFKLGLLVSSMTVFAMGVVTYHSRLSSSFWGSTGTTYDSLDQFWQETGLNLADLGSFINSNNCLESDKKFLGCVYGLHRASQKLGLSFLPPNIISSGENDFIGGLSEKEYIKRWLPYLKNKAQTDFNQILTQLAELSQGNKISSVVGDGINGYLSIVKDPHTYILPSRYYKEVISQPAPQYPSLGVSLVKGNSGYFVRKVLKGSVADRNGIQRGDYVISINGKQTAGLNNYQVSELIRAKENSVTRLQVRRQGKNLNISILREKISATAVTEQIFQAGRKLGIVSIHKFSQEVCQLTEKALVNFKQQKVEGVLLDLRDNSGGLMDEAACVVSLFSGPGKVAYRVQFLDRTIPDEVIYTTEDRVWSGPVGLLVNSGSASSSEIVAGALRDLIHAPIVGERTFGKGTFQEGDLWENNGKIALFQTSGIYYLPSGYSPQIQGIDPDYHVQMTEAVPSREADQYAFPIMPKKKFRNVLPRISRNCLKNQNVSSDPELNSAVPILFCNLDRLGVAE